MEDRTLVSNGRGPVFWGYGNEQPVRISCRCAAVLCLCAVM